MDMPHPNINEIHSVETTRQTGQYTSHASNIGCN